MKVIELFLAWYWGMVWYEATNPVAIPNFLVWYLTPAAMICECYRAWRATK